jgi:hypothetical protein
MRDQNKKLTYCVKIWRVFENIRRVDFEGVKISFFKAENQHRRISWLLIAGSKINVLWVYHHHPAVCLSNRPQNVMSNCKKKNKEGHVERENTPKWRCKLIFIDRCFYCLKVCLEKKCEERSKFNARDGHKKLVFKYYKSCSIIRQTA